MRRLQIKVTHNGSTCLRSVPEAGIRSQHQQAKTLQALSNHYLVTRRRWGPPRAAHQRHPGPQTDTASSPVPTQTRNRNTSGSSRETMLFVVSKRRLARLHRQTSQHGSLRSASRPTAARLWHPTAHLEPQATILLTQTQKKHFSTHHQCTPPLKQWNAHSSVGSACKSTSLRTPITTCTAPLRPLSPRLAIHRLCQVPPLSLKAFVL